MNMLRKFLRLSLKATLNLFDVNLVNYRNNTIKNDPLLVQLLTQMRLEGRARQSFEELHNIYRLSKATLPLAGNIAEVGVYKGGTAKLIAMNKGSKKFYLFDSFEGMAITSTHDVHRKGDFHETSLNEVQRYLSVFQDIYFLKGWFPKTTEGLEQTRYSFVHLDVDLYQSTFDALSFFYPRLVPGGVILSHDYNSISCPGVSKAFREYFSDKPVVIIELAGTTQCLVVKN